MAIQGGELASIPAVHHAASVGCIAIDNDVGMKVMERRSGMASVFPHWNPRAGKGQRVNTWEAIVLVDKFRAVHGGPGSNLILNGSTASRGYVAVAARSILGRVARATCGLV